MSGIKDDSLAGQSQVEVNEGFGDREITLGVQLTMGSLQTFAKILPDDEQLPFIWSVATSCVASMMETVLGSDIHGHEQMEEIVELMLQEQRLKRQAAKEMRDHMAEPGVAEGYAAQISDAIRAEAQALRAVTDPGDPDREVVEPLLGPADRVEGEDK